MVKSRTSLHELTRMKKQLGVIYQEIARYIGK
jgi:hypothetical protein